MIKTLNLTFSGGKDRSYPILIGSGILADPNIWQAHLPQKQVCIVSNEIVAKHYLEPLKNALQDKTVITVLLEEGETHKNIASWSTILDALVAAKFNRDAVIIALGGGIVGDIAGFAAASYQRGIACVQVPTTVLAQVDSSVGGKTGVNHPQGKNLIGAFHQPQAVIIDTDTIKTLPPREFAAGMAEVVKYGLINDPDFFAWLEDHQAAINAHEKSILVEMIAHCCANKAAVVQADEQESGQRALLNLGHTFGHALEAVTHYQRWKHGEGVAIGTMCAMYLSEQRGAITAEERERAERLFHAFSLPTKVPQDLKTSEIYAAMQLDKKVKNGKMRLILQKKFCESIIDSESEEKAVFLAIDQCRNV